MVEERKVVANIRELKNIGKEMCDKCYSELIVTCTIKPYLKLGEGDLRFCEEEKTRL